jgi:hypothetical protein
MVAEPSSMRVRVHAPSSLDPTTLPHTADAGSLLSAKSEIR